MTKYVEFLKGLSPDNFIQLLEENRYGIRKTASQLGVDKNVVRRWLQKLGCPNAKYETVVDFVRRRKKFKKPDYKTFSPKVKKYVITAVLNNVSLHKNMYKCIKKFMQYNNAELIAVPLYYKNVSLYSGHQVYWWPSELNGSYLDADHTLNKNLMVLGNLKIQATAKRPLQGLHGYNGDKSCIVAHPRVAQDVVPDAIDGYPVVRMSTGSMSEAEYSQTNAGYLGEHHHQLSALYVEVGENGEFFHRWLHYDEETKTIYDLDYVYPITGEVEKYVNETGVLTASLPDGHLAFKDDKAFNGICNLLKRLKPEKSFAHDMFDCFAVSHHHQGDPFLKYRKHLTQQDSLEIELQKTEKALKTLADCAPANSIHMVPSNHHDHLYKWLKSGTGLNDPVNIKMFFKLGLIMCDLFNVSGSGQVVTNDELLQYALHPDVSSRFVWTERGTSICINNVEHNLHGDIAPGGKRGSPQSFVKYRRKVTSGHHHTPTIIDGVYVNGVMTFKLNYMSAASSWLTAMTVMYPNGKRTLIHVINGDYELE